MTDASKGRIYLLVIALLLIVIAGMGYTFIVAGSTAPGDEGRTAVVLEPAERALLLREMRGFVGGLQRITDGLSRDDMKAVAQVARGLGGAKAHDAPVGMLGKLPLEFKQLAFETHGGFDTLANDAEAGITRERALAQVSAILKNCVACHDRFQVGNPPGR